MFKRARSRLSYANVASTFALGVALTTGGAYAANEWTGENIVDQSLTAADLAIGTIGTLRLADDSVQAVDIAPGAVTSSEVADGSLTEADLGADSVGPSEVAANSIDSDELVDSGIFAPDIATNAVGSAEIATDAVGSAEITSNSVGASELADNSVAGANVISNSLTFSDIAGGAATGSVSYAAGAAPNGRCIGTNILISGGTAGDAVVFSVRGPMQAGVFLYGIEVTSSTNLRAALCNFSGTTMNAISNLPVRILTFR